MDSVIKTSIWRKNLNKKILGLLIILFLIVGFLGYTVYKGKVDYKDTINFEENKASTNEEFTSAEEEIFPENININLLAAGDIMFHYPQCKAAYDVEKQAYDFYPVFRHVEKYIKRADIAIANFETVTAGDHIKFSGFPKFNTPKETLYGIKEAGFDILSTANNHSLDQGKNGLIKTIEAIEEYGLKNIGTYKEAGANILIEDVKGIKLGFLSYTYGLNGMDKGLNPEELSYMVNIIDEEKIKSDIEKTKDLDADLTVVFMHWGVEYARQASSSQIILGEKMVEWGADIILGSHPHVIQKSQIIEKDGKDKFIIYSMGNFLSNQRHDTMQNSYTEDGVIINLNIEKDFNSEETIIKDIEYIPTWINKYREEGKVFYEILPVKDVIESNLDVKGVKGLDVRLKKSYGDTMEMMN